METSYRAAMPEIRGDIFHLFFLNGEEYAGDKKATRVREVSYAAADAECNLLIDEMLDPLQCVVDRIRSCCEAKSKAFGSVSGLQQRQYRPASRCRYIAADIISCG